MLYWKKTYGTTLIEWLKPLHIQIVVLGYSWLHVRKKVTKHIAIPTHIHILKELDQKKSSKFLSSTCLPSYQSPLTGYVVEFEELGRLFACKYDRLPLALTILGDYLSKKT
jgi:hypothetical protein